MLTIDLLKELGANAGEGISRCMNNETFYLRMVDMGLRDKNFDVLIAAIRENRLADAFEAAHALKGVLSNLSLTPVLKPVQEITELLRAHTETDYSELLDTITRERDKFLSHAE
jgi:HPt (histidine-containing phosphotransfer) domain-containing protein